MNLCMFNTFRAEILVKRNLLFVYLRGNTRIFIFMKVHRLFNCLKRSLSLILSNSKEIQIRGANISMQDLLNFVMWEGFCHSVCPFVIISRIAFLNKFLSKLFET
jgi:hypothetical protein